MAAARISTLAIRDYEHVGIRVADRERALAFYAQLGFQFRDASSESPSRSVEIINEHGVRISLICNAEHGAGGRNVLLDEHLKHPGLTHVAFDVRSVKQAAAFLRRHRIRITEGPKSLPRRRCLSFRDPDGNVIEISEYRRLRTF